MSLDETDEDPGRNFGAPLHERARAAYKEAKASNSKCGNHMRQIERNLDDAPERIKKIEKAVEAVEKRVETAEKRLAKFKEAIDTYLQ